MRSPNKMPFVLQAGQGSCSLAGLRLRRAILDSRINFDRSDFDFEVKVLAWSAILFFTALSVCFAKVVINVSAVAAISSLSKLSNVFFR